MCYFDIYGADGKLDLPATLFCRLRSLVSPSIRTRPLLMLGFEFPPPSPQTFTLCDVLLLNYTYLSSVQCEFGAKMLNYVCRKDRSLMPSAAIDEWIISSLVACRRRSG